MAPLGPGESRMTAVRQIYEAAMDRLAAELAALDKTDKPTAAIKLAEFLKTI